jgi:hypothetical protein
MFSVLCEQAETNRTSIKLNVVIFIYVSVWWWAVA